MRSRATSRVATILSLVVIGLLAGERARGEQAPAVKKQIVLKEATSLPDRDAIMALVELPPGSSEGRHTHAGELFGFVVEGAITLVSEGSPTAKLTAGEVYHVLPGRVHDVINEGSVVAKTAVVLVAERGKAPTTEVK
ncbi:MAG: cupin domain-containing protein [Holophagales bacterium]|nr:MAG: cupin domain-containing protein [Holophagales bacterium]